MGTSIFKEQVSHLALKNSDVKFYYDRRNVLKRVLVNANKVIELRENQLLKNEKLREYSEIWLIHDKKIIKIPVVKGSWNFCGQKDGLLRFSIAPNVRLERKDMHNWHLKLFK
ncbi:hypothetical protein A5881_003968 [Enterococcus termitis]|nr:hypothetical protein A5881_003812 [Enterococcus termitis]